MISVKEAEKLILSTVSPNRETIILDIEDLSDEVIAQQVLADRDYPPYHRVAMDGIAISFRSWENGARRFKIEGCQRAGSLQMVLKDVFKGCIEVMTGAVLPVNCDTVIKYEDLIISEGVATLAGGLHVEKMQNVHQKGFDAKAGDVLIPDRSFLSSTHWAVVASSGVSRVKVVRKPVISIISTGNEIVGVDEVPTEYQIRDSNAYALMSSLRANGFGFVNHFHLDDEESKIRRMIEGIIKSSDIVIVTGGVSKGKFDFIPKILVEIGVKRIFHGVRQRPGKPMWYGVYNEQKLVFGLPGNPVSTLVCLHRYVLPALWRYMGIEPDVILRNRPYAVLDEDYRFNKPLTRFLPVKVRYSKKGIIQATPVTLSGSGDLVSLMKSSGFVELEEDRDFFPAGEAFSLYLWRDSRI